MIVKISNFTHGDLTVVSYSISSGLSKNSSFSHLVLKSSDHDEKDDAFLGLQLGVEAVLRGYNDLVRSVSADSEEKDPTYSNVNEMGRQQRQPPSVSSKHIIFRQSAVSTLRCLTKRRKIS